MHRNAPGTRDRLRVACSLPRYLNVKDDYLQELTERKPLTLVKA
jgi:hypothetical protein